MSQNLIYEIIDLESAEKFLKDHKESVTLTNPQGSTKYYGMRVLDYMFNKLSEKFSQVAGILVNVDDDHAALFTAIKLGYKNIVYTGESYEAKMILETNKNNK